MIEPWRSAQSAPTIHAILIGGKTLTARAMTIGFLTGGLIAGGACVQGLPRRVSGSDLTLPERGDRAAARSIRSRCNDTDTTSTVHDPTSRCGTTSGDTVRSTSDPLVPPPQSTP
jgi:hypothetical protein